MAIKDDVLKNLTTTAKTSIVDAVNELNSKKVNAVSGKGLSTSDYTAAEKTKLAGIATGANNYVLPAATTSASGGVILVNGLTSTDATKVLTAAQGKILNDAKAPIASPAFTGTPTSPTAAAGTATTQIATTAFVSSAVSTGVNGVNAGINKLEENLTSLKMAKTVKDVSGVYTTVTYRRKSDNTLYCTSVLSGGTSPLYTTRTEKYYAANGTTLLRTVTYALSYDEDGNLIGEA